jgi:hypothetical protein
MAQIAAVSMVTAEQLATGTAATGARPAIVGQANISATVSTKDPKPESLEST